MGKMNGTKEVDAVTRKLNEAQSQIDFLKESNSSSKVEFDLKLEKIRKEQEVDLSNFHTELDKKDTLVEKLEEEIEVLISKVETANASVADLHETLARTKGEHD